MLYFIILTLKKGFPNSEVNIKYSLHLRAVALSAPVKAALLSGA
jgi:hypothetical protein